MTAGMTVREREKKKREDEASGRNRRDRNTKIYQRKYQQNNDGWTMLYILQLSATERHDPRIRHDEQHPFILLCNTKRLDKRSPIRRSVLYIDFHPFCSVCSILSYSVLLCLRVPHQQNIEVIIDSRSSLLITFTGQRRKLCHSKTTQW